MIFKRQVALVPDRPGKTEKVLETEEERQIGLAKMDPAAFAPLYEGYFPAFTPIVCAVPASRKQPRI